MLVRLHTVSDRALLRCNYGVLSWSKVFFHHCLDNVTLKLCMCFSLVKNTKAVMNTNAPDRAILSINGIRTISMMWVILSHCYAIGEIAGGLGK